MDDVYVTAPKFVDTKFVESSQPSKCRDLRRMVPIFLVSNVTGKNIPLLTAFLNLLPPQVRHNESLALPPCEFMV